jgi:hypothetical protein
MSTLPPLAEGNRLQRAYARWAERHYRRMSPELRAQAEVIDRFLYSRAGLGLWLGLAAAVAGSCMGLIGAGVPAPVAVIGSLVVWVGLPLAGLAVWLVPSDFTSPPKLRRALFWAVPGALMGGLLGFSLGHVKRHGRLDLALLAHELLERLGMLLPAVLGVMLAIGLLLWVLARLRLDLLARHNQQLRLQQERDAAALAATAAQLQLLQAQIQPHFVFNTLSALQHWVDQGDARAGPLLRELTAFLRGSTSLLLRESVTLAEEMQMAEHYLAIMRARLGDRLRSELHVAPGLAEQQLPPGLLLTLVENAVEHGVSQRLEGGLVQVSATGRPGSWVLKVCDDGVGLGDAVAGTDGSSTTAAKDGVAGAASGAFPIATAGVGPDVAAGPVAASLDHPGVSRTPRPPACAASGRRGVGLVNSRQRIAHFWRGHAQLDLRPLAQGTCACLIVDAPGGAAARTADDPAEAAPAASR